MKIGPIQKINDAEHISWGFMENGEFRYYRTKAEAIYFRRQAIKWAKEQEIKK